MKAQHPSRAGVVNMSAETKALLDDIKKTLTAGGIRNLPERAQDTFLLNGVSQASIVRAAIELLAEAINGSGAQAVATKPKKVAS